MPDTRCAHLLASREKYMYSEICVAGGGAGCVVVAKETSLIVGTPKSPPMNTGLPVQLLLQRLVLRGVPCFPVHV